MGGSIEGGLALYALNLSVSSVLFQWIGVLEVLLRNSLVRTLQPRVENRQFDPILAVWQELTPAARAAHGRALDRIRAKGMTPSVDAVISELPLSCWRYLLASRHHNTLWIQHFRHAFPGLKPQTRQVVYGHLEQVVLLRNRIAHHEPIFDRVLGRDLAGIQQLIGWISPEALAWARANLPDLATARI
jgi:hypothetical protein